MFRELFLFGLIGGIGAVVYAAINYGFTSLGIRPSVSIALTLVLLIPPVYYLQYRLTFRSARSHLSAFPRYAGTQLFGNVLAMIATELVPGPIEAYPMLSWIVIAVVVAAINYGILKFWAFSHRPVRHRLIPTCMPDLHLHPGRSSPQRRRPHAAAGPQRRAHRRQ